MRLVLRDVEVGGHRTDVVVDGGVIISVGPASTGGADEVLAGEGGALIPGLWDHHVHLLATAAAESSVRAGPPDVSSVDELRRALTVASGRRPGGGWIRAVGYHESVAGDLDRHGLDAIVGDRPVRVQHRSGALWILNSTGAEYADLDHADLGGIERDHAGRATGRVFGADDWLRDRITADDAVPDVGAVGARLTRLGVAGVTDATPDADTTSWELLAAAASDGRLPQHVVVTGGPELTATAAPPPLLAGPVKLYLADHALPTLDDLAARIDAAHRTDRAVAFHSVTRLSLALAVAALDTAGSRAGDRVEHGAVVPPDLAARLVDHGLTVVTQPGFVAARGDQYLADVDADDLPHLYPCASLLAAGIPVGGSTDAPFTELDPWAAITAATERRAPSGAIVGPGETVTARRALDLFLTPPDDPGGSPRRVAAGAPADLCLLDRPLDDALARPSADAVRATVIEGVLRG
ncbi:MAG: amidohydrolase family protein [Acidimicrobiales bacterium]|nr:amidohydrolase family protein [Acidimicrobiales bacterium]